MCTIISALQGVHLILNDSVHALRSAHKQVVIVPGKLVACEKQEVTPTDPECVEGSGG